MLLPPINLGKLFSSTSVRSVFRSTSKIAGSEVDWEGVLRVPTPAKLIKHRYSDSGQGFELLRHRLHSWSRGVTPTPAKLLNHTTGTPVPKPCWCLQKCLDLTTVTALA